MADKIGERILEMGRTYKEMKGEPKWERIKKRDWEHVEEEFQAPPPPPKRQISRVKPKPKKRVV